MTEIPEPNQMQRTMDRYWPSMTGGHGKTTATTWMLAQMLAKRREDGAPGIFVLEDEAQAILQKARDDGARPPAGFAERFRAVIRMGRLP